MRFFKIIVCLLLICFALFLFASVIHFKVSIPGANPQFDQDNLLRIKDIVYHQVLVNKFWDGEINSIYTFDDQRTGISKFIDKDIQAAMPIGMSPSVLYILFPFSLISKISLSFAITSWIVLSWSIFILSLYLLFQFLKENQPITSLFLLALTLCCTSGLIIITTNLGQTTIFAIGVLNLLVYQLFNSTDKSARSIITKSILSCLLSIKAPYYLLSILLLAIKKEYKSIVISLTIFILLFIILEFMTTGLLFSEFIDQITIYTQNPIPVWYESSIHLEIQATLVTFLTNITSSYLITQQAIELSSVLLYTILILSLYLGVSNEKFYILSAVSIFLFLPYLGRYEDLLFISLIIFALCEFKNRKLPYSKLLVIGILAYGLQIHFVYRHLIICFLLKVISCTAISYSLIKSEDLSSKLNLAATIKK